jgi:uncharacterized protein YigA (DUF484 family)
MSDISADDVADYLQQHPDFFQDYLDLLEVLTIPHPSGTAVSLLVKQVQLLRDKHDRQEQRLAELLEIAKANDVASTKLHQLSLSLFNTNSLEEAATTLGEALMEYFASDFVALRLIQPCPNEALATLFIDPQSNDVKAFMKEIGSQQIKCARPTLAQAKILFGDQALAVNSCALIPMRLGESDGILAIGSREAGRFHFSMGQLFLSQIGELVAARLHSLLPS